MRIRLTAHLLALLLICQIGAVWSVFSTAMWLHKQHKQSRLADKSQWVGFTFSTSELESRLIEEDEFEIDGILYDIVSIRPFESGVEVTAVSDHAENKMKRTLHNLQNEKTGWSELAKLAQSFSYSVFRPEQGLRIAMPVFKIEITYFNYPDNNCHRGLPRIPELPPAANDSML
jgi:hypothetical protein